jgi:hypothetical protein
MSNIQVWVGDGYEVQVVDDQGNRRVEQRPSFSLKDNEHLEPWSPGVIYRRIGES